tara:strand:+ start:1225 stop:1431 length:207 start_codon:yes stop_codon:yes gene_type:complete
MNVSEQFERALNPEKFKGSEARTTRVARAPRRTNDAQQLAKEYRKYRNMGFSPKECEWKTYHHHTYKL